MKLICLHLYNGETDRKSSSVNWQSVKRRFKDFYLEYSEWLDASYEFLVVYIASNIPYIALALIHVLGTRGASMDVSTFHAVIANSVQPGEILIYVSTLIAPFVYVLLQYVRALRRFPMYGLSILITATVYFYCMIVFSMYKNGSIQNQPFIERNAPYFYALALILWYFSLVYGRKLSKPEKRMGSNAQSLIDELSE